MKDEFKKVLVNFFAYHCKQLASGPGVLSSKVVVKITFQLIARFERNGMAIAIQTFAFLKLVRLDKFFQIEYQSQSFAN